MTDKPFLIELSKREEYLHSFIEPNFQNSNFAAIFRISTPSWSNSFFQLFPFLNFYQNFVHVFIVSDFSIKFRSKLLQKNRLVQKGKLSVIIFIRDYNSQGQEISGYIDFGHRLENQNYKIDEILMFFCPKPSESCQFRLFFSKSFGNTMGT